MFHSLLYLSITTIENDTEASKFQAHFMNMKREHDHREENHFKVFKIHEMKYTAASGKQGVSEVTVTPSHVLYSTYVLSCQY
jgi:hypothetical protein